MATINRVTFVSFSFIAPCSKFHNDYIESLPLDILC
jgi:hypothetical protein